MTAIRKNRHEDGDVVDMTLSQTPISEELDYNEDLTVEVFSQMRVRAAAELAHDEWIVIDGYVGEKQPTPMAQ